MAKKKKQVMSFDPFLRDEFGNPIGTALPPPGAFIDVDVKTERGGSTEESKAETFSVQETAKQTVQKTEGQAFIRQREKLKSKLMEAGMTSREAGEEAFRRLAAEEPGFGGEPGPQVGAGEFGARQEAREEVAGKVGELEEAETSQEKALIKDVSPLSVAGQTVLNQAEKTTLISGLSVQTPILAKVMAGIAGYSFAGAIGARAVTAKTMANSVSASSLLKVGGLSLIAGKIQISRKQEVKNAAAAFSQSKAQIQRIINNVHSGQISNSEAVRLFNIEKQNINDIEVSLKQLTTGNAGLNAFLSGGEYQMINVLSYKSLELPFQEIALRNAILNPEPEKISFLQEDLEGGEI